MRGERKGSGGGRNFPPPSPYARKHAHVRRGVNLSSRRKIPLREREVTGEKEEREREGERGRETAEGREIKRRRKCTRE